MISIGEQLRNARLEQKLTCKQLAEKANISMDCIYRVEKNRNGGYTYVHTLQQLQKALNIKFDI